MKAAIAKLGICLALMLTLGVKAHAGTSFVNSGLNTGVQFAYYDTTVMTTATTTASASLYVQNYSTVEGAGGGCGIDLTGTGVILTIGVQMGPGANSKSASGTANPSAAGSYGLSESWGGYPSEVYGSASITLNW
jgi:hypothetical protein